MLPRMLEARATVKKTARSKLNQFFSVPAPSRVAKKYVELFPSPVSCRVGKKFARVFRNFPIGLRQYLPMHVWCVRPVRGVAFTTMLRINPGGTGRVARPSLAAPPLTLLKF